MRNETRKQFIKKLLIILSVILILFGLGISVYKIVSLASLDDIEVSGQSLTCSDNAGVADYIKKQNINYFHFKNEDFRIKLGRNFFCIGKIETSVSYPNKLKIKVFAREGEFVIKAINTPLQTNPEIILSAGQLSATQSSSEAFPPKVLRQIIETVKDASSSSMFLVDSEGVVFQEVSASNFPRINIFGQEFKIGDKISGDQMKKISDAVKKLKELEVFVDNLIIVGDKLIADTNPRIIFALSRPLDRQTASLQLILSQAKMNSDPGTKDSISIESIDLRFNKPVVVYYSKKK